MVRCDNSGENLILEQAANGKNWEMEISFDYTGTGTPQMNQLAELVSIVIGSRGRALMNHTNATNKIRYRMYKEAYSTATMLYGLAVIDIDGNQATMYDNFCGSNP